MSSKETKTTDSRLLGSCPICKFKFTWKMTTCLEKVRGMETLYVECKGCKSSVVLGIANDIPGVVTTMGMLTDMNREDIERLGRMRAISADDVLEMHKHLENKR